MEGTIAFEFSFISYPRDHKKWCDLDRREWWANTWWDPDHRFISFGFRLVGFGFDVTIDY
jgi:hypothetical protein